MVRRLRIYFIGFGLGLIVVYMTFLRNKDRDLDFWTPSQRVLESIRSDERFQKSRELDCYAQCLSLDSATIKSLWKDAKVKSLNPGGEPYRYMLSLETENEHLEASIEQQKGEHELLSIKSYTNPKSCDC